MALENIEVDRFVGGQKITKIDSPNRRGLAVIINEIITEANSKGASIDLIDSNKFEGGSGITNVSSYQGKDLADILEDIITFINDEGGSLDVLGKDYFSAKKNIHQVNNPNRLAKVLNGIIDGVNSIIIGNAIFLLENLTSPGGWIRKYPIAGGSYAKTVPFIGSGTDVAREMIVRPSTEHLFVAGRNDSTGWPQIDVFDLDLNPVRVITMGSSPLQVGEWFTGMGMSSSQQYLYAISLTSKRVVRIDLNNSDNVDYISSSAIGIPDPMGIGVASTGEIVCCSKNSVFAYIVDPLNGSHVDTIEFTGFTPTNGFTFNTVWDVFDYGGKVYALCGDSSSFAKSALVRFTFGATFAYDSAHVDLDYGAIQVVENSGKAYISTFNNGFIIVDLATMSIDSIVTTESRSFGASIGFTG